MCHPLEPSLWASLVVGACLRCRRPGFDRWAGKIPWRREWQSTLVLLPGESQGQRSLAGYSPWGHKESDTTGWLTLSLGRGSMGPKCTSLKPTCPLTVHVHPGMRVALAEATVLCKFCNHTTDKVGPTFLHKPFSNHVVEYEIPRIHLDSSFSSQLLGNGYIESEIRN